MHMSSNKRVVHEPLEAGPKMSGPVAEAEV